MSKSYLIGVIILLVIGGGYYLVKSMNPTTNNLPINPPVSSPEISPQNSPVSSASPSTTQSVTINYSSGGGFDPKNLTIKTGTTVVWTNNDSDPMQIDSDPHPIHTSFPPLNATSPTQPGATYSFTFTEAGSYGYHNHLSPGDKGTITVQP